MEFLTPGQKIKKFRKILNMKQSDLQGENVTRALISLIEVDKRNVSKETSLVLANRFREKAILMGVEIDVDNEYFKRSQIEDAEIYCNNKLSKQPSQEELELILDITERFGLDSIKAQALRFLGDLFYNESKYEFALTNYLGSVDIFSKLQLFLDLGYIYNRIGMCKTNMLIDMEALLYFNKAYYYSSLNNDKDTKKKVIYNIGRCYKKLQRFDEAIQYIEEFISLCDKEKEFISYAYAKILISNCYRRKKMFDKSVSIYEELIPQCDKSGNVILGYIYNNLGDIYLELNEVNKSLRYFELSEEIRKGLDEDNLPYTFIEKARIYIKMKNYEEAKSLIYKSLDFIKRKPNIEIEIAAYYCIAEIYSIIKDFEGERDAFLHLSRLVKDKEL